MTSSLLPRPELLAPAGDRDCLRAAIENGADAVYFGLNCGFNARARATNIAPDELSDVIALLHHRGVKGYVTLNTLAFSDELPELEKLVRHIAVSDVDAVLVQDLGLARLIRAICPELAIHASTQMTLTSAECIHVVEELGIERVVLPRELSIREIAKLKAATAVELEAFVHGALCVAYSGQCLTSESLGGRSANRGQCAQACRLPYTLICDGKDLDLGDQKYLLSPQDLAAYDLTTDLIVAGVSSFKIEGRLKTPEYVANITKHYRAAIDAAVCGEPIEFTREEVREMELSFSRGFSPGWLKGDDHKMLVPGFSSAKRGVFSGEIIRVRDASVEIRLDGPISRGDGVVFEGDRASLSEQGGRVFGLFHRGHSVESAESGTIEVTFQRGVIDFTALHTGQAMFKTDDPKLTAKLRRSFSGPDPLRKRPLDLTVRCVVGEPLVIEGDVDKGIRLAVTSAEPLSAALKHPVSRDFLKEQLSRLGNTVFELRDLKVEIIGNPMVPLSVLSKLRHELVSRLDNATRTPRGRALFNGNALALLRDSVREVEKTLTSGESQLAENSLSSVRVSPRLHILVRTLEQLKTCVNLLRSDEGREVSSLLYADFQDIREYREAVAISHDAGRPIFLATPRIQKPDEAGLFRALLKHAADGILVRNLAGLKFYSSEGVSCVADYSLNCTNELTASFLIEHGASRITASYDMNRDQLLDLVRVLPPNWAEVVVHQHMPMFHMEHCVFCSVLSPGTNKHNCGRPCDSHVVQLRDRVGTEHPLQADVGCRNTLFNAIPQSGAEVIASLVEIGIRNFRIEFLDEHSAEIRRVISLYHDLLAGRVRGDAVWSQLKASNRVGVTRGTLEERRNPLAIL